MECRQISCYGVCARARAQRITVPHKVFSRWLWFFCEIKFLGVDSSWAVRVFGVFVANEVDESDDKSEERGAGNHLLCISIYEMFMTFIYTKRD